ncbi:class I SAM-dependent methyltransferase [Deltaproteobacteria bacterium Smac51]|nr:class I SAM-dependent methyltransferase [Deltaproteobacteria bacterium Smac51]
MEDKHAMKHGEPLWYGAMKKARRTGPATAEELTAARRGEFDVALTAYKSAPRHWFPQTLEDRRILCLAGEVGAQGHILAAAGAQVTIFSRSEARLDRDREISRLEKLDLTAVMGDFRNLSVFPKEYFDLIFCPASVPYVPEVRKVFRECGRVLKHGGIMMLGVSLPSSAEENNISRSVGQGASPIEFSHTLEELIGGQIEAGMVIIGFYEDTDEEAICDYIPRYFATRALKL